MILRLKIDVSKIDKALLFKGDKGVYLDATCFVEETESSYGDHGTIRQDLGQERRQKGEKGAVLGNCKIVSFRWAKPSHVSPTSEDDDDRIPF